MVHISSCSARRAQCGAPAHLLLGRQGVPHALQVLVQKGALSAACGCAQDATNVGDEGGFAPSINSTTEGLDLIVAAIAVRPAASVMHMTRNLKTCTLTLTCLDLGVPPCQRVPLRLVHTLTCACTHLSSSPCLDGMRRRSQMSSRSICQKFT